MELREGCPAWLAMAPAEPNSTQSLRRLCGHGREDARDLHAATGNARTATFGKSCDCWNSLLLVDLPADCWTTVCLDAGIQTKLTGGRFCGIAIRIKLLIARRYPWNRARGMRIFYDWRDSSSLRDSLGIGGRAAGRASSGTRRSIAGLSPPAVWTSRRSNLVIHLNSLILLAS